MKVWESNETVKPGYECNGFAEICESVMFSTEHKGYVGIMFHAAEDVTTTDGKTFDAVWVVQIDRATEDSYSMEQFAYAEPHSTVYQVMYDDYQEAKQAWLGMLTDFVPDRGV
jgi:hypothetical protein